MCRRIGIKARWCTLAHRQNWMLVADAGGACSCIDHPSGAATWRVRWRGCRRWAWARHGVGRVCAQSADERAPVDRRGPRVPSAYSSALPRAAAAAACQAAGKAPGCGVMWVAAA